MSKEITTYEEARAALPHLTPERADAVMDYTAEGARRYGGPVDAERLKDNADHLAEEGLLDGARAAERRYTFRVGCVAFDVEASSAKEAVEIAQRDLSGYADVYHQGYELRIILGDITEDHIVEVDDLYEHGEEDV